MEEKKQNTEIPSYLLTELEDLVFDTLQTAESVALLAAVLDDSSPYSDPNN